ATWTARMVRTLGKARKLASARATANRGAKIMASSVELFHHKYANSQRRLHELLQWAADANTQRAMPGEMVEELSAALEELHVAAEIMHEQADRLAESQHVIETERSHFQELFDLAPDGY